MGKILLTNHTAERTERQRALDALSMMKKLEKRRKLVSYRLDDKTIIATTKRKMKDLIERHGVRDNTPNGRVVYK